MNIPETNFSGPAAEEKLHGQNLKKKRRALQLKVTGPTVQVLARKPTVGQDPSQAKLAAKQETILCHKKYKKRRKKNRVEEHSNADKCTSTGLAMKG